jgi:NAD(P)-dependent dehydrogenase (short-subunit alcohol dehydrogenase family)
MTDKKTWLITGAGRGMGVEFAKAALAAGNAVVATGRNPDTVAKAVGEADDLLVVELDVTNTDDAEAAVKAAVDRFGRIDVLVNNAASFYAGYFEELTPEQMERQLATSLVGPMNVTRAVLPVMREQRSGHVVTISSSAGFAGSEYGTGYAASKFGVDGWMESLTPEVEPFGIQTTIVNPGFFRTELLTKESTNYAAPSIEDYAERNAAQREFWESQNGQQIGDPTKLAQALLTIADEEPPTRSRRPSRRSPSFRRRSTPSASCRRPSHATTSRRARDDHRRRRSRARPRARPHPTIRPRGRFGQWLLHKPTASPLDRSPKRPSCTSRADRPSRPKGRSWSRPS